MDSSALFSTFKKRLEKTSYKYRLYHLTLCYYLKILKASENTLYFKDIKVNKEFLSLEVCLNEKNFIINIGNSDALQPRPSGFC